MSTIAIAILVLLALAGAGGYLSFIGDLVYGGAVSDEGGLPAACEGGSFG